MTASFSLACRLFFCPRSFPLGCPPQGQTLFLSWSLVRARGGCGGGEEGVGVKQTRLLRDAAVHAAGLRARESLRAGAASNFFLLFLCYEIVRVCRFSPEHAHTRQMRVVLPFLCVPFVAKASLDGWQNLCSMIHMQLVWLQSILKKKKKTHHLCKQMENHLVSMNWLQDS
jgi:hypothetical protein